MPARSSGIPIPITPMAKQPSHSLQSSTIHIQSSIPEPIWPSTATKAGLTPITASIPANSTCSSPSQLSLSSYMDKRKRKEYHDPHYTDIKPLDPWAEETKTFFGREHMLDIGFKSWFVCEAENTEDDGPEVCKHMYSLELRDVCAWLMGTEE
ncbi:hypothetical protein L211DRAFT_852395 [Terfezia boudieri ATCC MYA-4762]|uniref:Uncharacterized protein n=1 Tax=Terfezia boudieri ATCC MYA-4762 TaxID=1051890 RepID=A0A3N4LFX2_9PEZI|nr:hypothetical protein L211DRAFT_852395 [Terfezia boudieri ATCC MYA-4762]